MAADLRHLARSFPAKPIEVLRGRGHLLDLADGRTITDLGGASHGAANFGHAHPRIVEAIQRQAAEMAHCSGTVPQRVRADFLNRLHRLLPAHLEQTFLANSGTEAVEAALKHAVAATGRTRFVALRGAFHGRTLGSLGATFRPSYRSPFAALLPQVDFVAVNDVAALEATVNASHAAILVEPIQGEGGLASCSPDFLRACQRVAHQHGALLVVDEVQTGLGRTGTDLAIEPSGIRPDLLLLGKSLGGGVPFGSCSMTADVARRMPAGGHGSTFGGNPLACAAGSAALDVLREEGLAQQARRTGDHVRRRLEALQGPVREVRGRGLMLGVDLRVKSAPVLDGLLRRGHFALAAGPTVVRFLPPLAIPQAVVDEAAQSLQSVLQAMPAAPPNVPAETEA